jgi:hypothetical protein
MAQPGILPAEEPTEFRLIEAVRAMLAAAVGADYIYDALDAYIVQKPQVKHLTEGTEAVWPSVLYLVSPGDVNPQDYTQCATLFPGDLLVTAGQKVGYPELPWESGYVPIPKLQMRMVQDVYRALHLKQIGDAILKIANRNLDLEVDGWALVQVQVSFEYTEVDS